MPTVKIQKRKIAANNQQNNQQQNKQNWKSKNPLWVMVENNIKIETEFFTIADEQRKAGKKDLVYFVLPRSTNVLSDLLEIIYLEDGVCKQKKLFAQNKPDWKWFMSIPMGDVQTPIVKNGWTVL